MFDLTPSEQHAQARCMPVRIDYPREEREALIERLAEEDEQEAQIAELRKAAKIARRRNRRRK